MLRIRTLLFITFFPVILSAQMPYTEKQYDWAVEKNLVYGTAVNYLGKTDSLTLDLYKPANSDSSRPILVLVHGGSWLGGCKEGMAWLCEEMAARGYVVATVNYRKGWHKDDYVGNPINPGVFPDGNCLYAADSLELIRAIYRGMQDVKGAIRWLKARVYTDSTCNQAVLVGGESAGAFLALATGLLDRPEEKPDACGPLADAPVPGNNLSNCYSVNCILQPQTVPPGGLTRPDLGSVDGDMNQNGFDASVLGVVSFYGGLPSQAFADDWLQGVDTPALYLYHQTCDGIVPFNYSKPFSIISSFCNLGFTPWHYNYPFVYGSGKLANHLATLPTPPLYQTDFLNCNSFNSNLALFECIRYNDNGSYHYTHNKPQRAEKVAAFFSPIVSAELASPPCLVSAAAPSWASEIRVAPNPFSAYPVLYCTTAPDAPVQLNVLDYQGRLLWQEKRSLQTGANPLPWDVRRPAGIYYLQVLSPKGIGLWKIAYLN